MVWAAECTEWQDLVGLQCDGPLELHVQVTCLLARLFRTGYPDLENQLIFGDYLATALLLSFVLSFKLSGNIV